MMINQHALVSFRMAPIKHAPRALAQQRLQAAEKQNGGNWRRKRDAYPTRHAHTGADLHERKAETTQRLCFIEYSASCAPHLVTTPCALKACGTAHDTETWTMRQFFFFAAKAAPAAPGVAAFFLLTVLLPLALPRADFSGWARFLPRILGTQ